MLPLQLIYRYHIDNYFLHLQQQMILFFLSFEILLSENDKFLIATSTFFPTIDLRIGFNFFVLDLTFLFTDLTILVSILFLILTLFFSSSLNFCFLVCWCMSKKLSCRCKFTKFMAYHILRYCYWYKFFSIIN